MYKLKNKKSEKVRGITLIALVITIIVLLILAGVSIAMLTGPNGLLTQADEAKTETDMAGAREKVQLAILGSYGEDGTLNPVELEKNLQEIPGANVGTQNLQEENLDVEVDGYTFEITKEGEIKDKGTANQTTDGDEVTPGVIVEGSNKTYTDADRDSAVIPVGFAIVPNLDDISEGLVISDKANDTTDEGNQFVWIPVKSADDYVRKEYPSVIPFDSIISDEKYLPTGVEVPIGKTEQQVEKDLVTKEGVNGFYISRYEAGDASASANRTEDSGTTGELVSKKDAYVYNYISQEDAKEKAKTFKVKDDTKVKSGLCTGIQWDMAMTFVNGKNDGESQPYNVKTVSASRHTNALATSGQNPADKVCNIYDLEGNFYEYVAEKNNNTGEGGLYISRGGNYYSNCPASGRNWPGGSAFGGHSFRFVLYLMQDYD